MPTPFGLRARTRQIDDPSKLEFMGITLSVVVVTAARSRRVKLALKQRSIDFGLWMLHGGYFVMGDGKTASPSFSLQGGGKNASRK